MAYNTGHDLADNILPGGQLVDVSGASVSYVAVPWQGVVQTAFACISAAVTGSDSVVTVKKKSGAATAVTLGTITIAVTGSAPGSVFEAVMTGSEADRTVTKGDTIQFDSDGVSSTTSIANFSAVLRGM